MITLKYNEAELKDFSNNAKFKTSGMGTFKYFNPDEETQIRIYKNKKQGTGSRYQNGKGYRVTFHFASDDGFGYKDYCKNDYAETLQEAKETAGKFYFNRIRN
jgi:hypothetical protein